MEKALEDIIGGERDSQVCWLGNTLSADTLTELRSSVTGYLFYIDGAKIKTRAEFLEKCCDVIHAPEYCINNFDALLDCLRSAYYYQRLKSVYILLFDNIDTFASSSSADFQLALKIMGVATEFWKERILDKRFYILLTGKREFLPGINTLRRI